jgi:hypothetical protein
MADDASNAHDANSTATASADEALAGAVQSGRTRPYFLGGHKTNLRFPGSTALGPTKALWFESISK